MCDPYGSSPCGIPVVAGRRVAVKMLHHNRMRERDLIEVKRTAEIQLTMRPHENIVQLLGVAWSVDHFKVFNPYV